jgi:rod shape determining protein RodA
VSATPIHEPARAEAPVRLPGVLPFDGVLALATIGIMICSLVMLHAATATDVPGNPNFYVTRQLVYCVVGGLIAVGLSRIDYSRLRELKYVLYAILVGSIVLVLGLGTQTKGAQRAIALPFFSFQASELGKVLLIVVL